MKLNKLSPAPFSTHYPKRVGRGPGSGMGKTSTRGHKGQKARKSGHVRAGFEGGQTPLYRRMPKQGFYSRLSKTRAEVRLSQLDNLPFDEINPKTLREVKIISACVKKIKIIKRGEINRKIVVTGIQATAGAAAAIVAAGGSVEG